MKVRPQYPAAHPFHGMEHMVMVGPIDAQVNEAEHISQKYRQQRRKRRQIRSVRHAQLENHDRDENRDHAIAESFEPGFSHARNASRVRFSLPVAVTARLSSMRIPPNRRNCSTRGQFILSTRASPRAWLKSWS